MTLRLGILASGSGSNAKAIIDAARSGRLDAEICLVLSDRPGAKVLALAQECGIDSLCLDPVRHESRESYDKSAVEALRAAGADTVALAGYMRLVTPAFLEAFPGRVLNLHPALLPSFPGLHATRACREYGARFSGCSVHFVSPVTDGGPIIIQAALPVRQDEDDSRLLERIHPLEHRIYPQALAWLAEGRLSLQGRRVLLAPGMRPLAPQPDMALVWPPLENGF